jgi:hypothetical protein
VSYARLPLSFEANEGQTDQRVKFLARGRGYGLFLTGNEAVLEVQDSGFRIQDSGPNARRSEVRSQELEARIEDSRFRNQDSGFRGPKPNRLIQNPKSKIENELQRTTDNGRRTKSPIENRQSAIENQMVRLRLVGANPKAEVVGADELPGKVNYFTGNDPARWRANVPTFAQVRYQSVYPGIDLVYYGNQAGQLEYDFVVAPGADASSILLALGAAGQVGSRQKAEGSRQKAVSSVQKAVGSVQPKLDSNGDLVVMRNGRGEVRFRKPLAYQEQESGARSQKSEAKDETRNSKISNRKSTIVNRQFRAACFLLDAQNRIHFSLGPYDHTRPLIIDPVLVYSTYLGGSGADGGSGIAVDSSGSAYITGYTSSANFPTAGPLEASLKGSQNAFVAKLNPAGSALVYSTYLGGSSHDQGFGIAVDSSGNAYVTGQATSTDFPTTPGAFQTSLRGSGVANAFVAKLDPTGSALVYSTYLGGSGGDGGYSIAVNSSGNAYVTGSTESSNFPTANPLQASLAGAMNAFVAELNPAGSALVYSTFLGGAAQDLGRGIALDSSGNAYVAGQTSSNNFPTTPGAFQPQLGPANNALTNAFVAKLNPTGSALVYSTYLGGSGSDLARGIAVNSTGNAYLTGSAQSANFPTANPLQANLAGEENAFVAELNSAGSGLVYSTYLGGSSSDSGSGIAVDSSGNAYVTGSAQSTNFPTSSPLQGSLAGATNAFAAELNSSGSALVYSTYLGGSLGDKGSAIAVDSSGNAYVTGSASSTDFPVLSPFQLGLAGEQNAFVAKIGGANSPGIAFGPGALTFSAQVVGTPSASQTVTVTATGSQPLVLTGVTISGDFTLASTATSCPSSGGTVAGGDTCTVDVIFTPSQSGTRSGSVVLNDNAGGSPQSVSLQGMGVTTAPGAAVSPASLAFGGQLLGTTSAAQPVTLKNTGNVALTITKISISGDFSQSNNCGGSLSAGSSCTINVTFTPQAPISGGSLTLTGALTITDNTRNNPSSTQTVSLSGAYEDFTLAPPSGLTTSATIAPGEAATYTLAVGSVGGFSLPVSLTCAGVPTDSTCVVTPNTATPGENVTVVVSTTAPSKTTPPAFPRPPWPLPLTLLMLAVVLAGIACAVRASRAAGESRWRAFLPLAAALLLALALVGCSGGTFNGFNEHGTAPGTYTISVTGSAGSGSATLSHSVTLTLNVT